MKIKRKIKLTAPHPRRTKVELPPCLDEKTLRERILELEEFDPIEEGLKKLIRNQGELINLNVLTTTIKNLVAAEKLEIIPESPELNCDGFCPKYKINRNRIVDVTTFLKNLREIDETGRLDKKD